MSGAVINQIAIKMAAAAVLSPLQQLFLPSSVSESWHPLSKRREFLRGFLQEKIRDIQLFCLEKLLLIQQFIR